jgi:hypothetical protein
VSQDTETTVVVFRKWTRQCDQGPGDDVIALFPEIPGSPGMCESFEHFGQHGSAGYDGVLSITRAATPDEYADLKRELEAEPYGYRLDVRLRRPH